MKHAFRMIDQERATLRILFCIGFEVPWASRVELKNLLKDYGVGGSSFLSSLRILKALRLVEEEEDVRNDRKIKVTKLSQKGLKVVEAISHLHDLL